MTLQVKAIDTFYGTSHILHGVSLDMADRELCAVLGRNGAGKTTLLRSITGVNPPTVGSIQLDGTEIAHLKSHRRAWLGISYVPQGREIIPDITVAENIYVALLGKGRKGKKVPSFVFDYFPALKALVGQKGGTLSGGQQQQLAIAGLWSRSRSSCSWTSRRKDCSRPSSRRSNQSSSAFLRNAIAPSSSSSRTWISSAPLPRNSPFWKRAGLSPAATSAN